MFGHRTEADQAGLIQQRYLDAKAAFEHKQYASAAEQFRQVVALLDDSSLAAGRASSLSDLRAVASGFLELAVLAQAAPTEPEESLPRAKATTGTRSGGQPCRSPASTPSTRNQSPRDADAPQQEAAAQSSAQSVRAYSGDDADVSRPIPIRQELPPWPGSGKSFQAMTLVNDPSVQLPSRSRGVLEMLIGERGNVESAVMRVPIQPFIDRGVTVAAKNWRYQPALKNGQPVKYKESVQVLLR